MKTRGILFLSPGNLFQRMGFGPKEVKNTGSQGLATADCQVAQGACDGFVQRGEAIEGVLQQTAQQIPIMTKKPIPDIGVLLTDKALPKRMSALARQVAEEVGFPGPPEALDIMPLFCVTPNSQSVSPGFYTLGSAHFMMAFRDGSLLIRPRLNPSHRQGISDEAFEGFYLAFRSALEHLDFSDNPVM